MKLAEPGGSWRKLAEAGGSWRKLRACDVLLKIAIDNNLKQNYRNRNGSKYTGLLATLVRKLAYRLLPFKWFAKESGGSCVNAMPCNR
jgi:hypothetical protein